MSTATATKHATFCAGHDHTAEGCDTTPCAGPTTTIVDTTITTWAHGQNEGVYLIGLPGAGQLLTAQQSWELGKALVLNARRVMATQVPAPRRPTHDEAGK